MTPTTQTPDPLDPDEYVIEDIYYCIVPNDPDEGVVGSFETVGKAKRAAAKLDMGPNSFTVRTMVSALWCLGLTKDDV